MKKLILGTFCFMTALAFAGDFDREEDMLERDLYKNFPVLEAGKNIKVKEIEVDIEDDKSIEIEVEFAAGSEVNVGNHDKYAKKISNQINKSINSTIGKEFELIKLELDTSGIKKDKKVYRY